VSVRRRTIPFHSDTLKTHRKYSSSPNHLGSTGTAEALRGVCLHVVIQCTLDAKTVRLIHQQSTVDARYRRLMEYAKLETASLAHVDETYFYGAYCRKCKHAARLSLEKLRNHLGDNFPLRKVKDRLRCERCSSRQIVITFLAPNQRTGNVVHLFNQFPRK
jgi:hypothetical protein